MSQPAQVNTPLKGINPFSCKQNNLGLVFSEVAPRLRSSVSENVLHSFEEEVWRSKDRSGGNKDSPGSRKFLSVLALLLAGVAVAGR